MTNNYNEYLEFLIQPVSSSISGLQKEIEVQKQQNSGLQKEINTSSFVDPRDGKVYKTVKIGNQVWMAQNLNYWTEGCYNYKIDPDGKKYGRLYDWETAMKICPPGWRLPTKKEWKTLIDFAGGDFGFFDLPVSSGSDYGRDWWSATEIDDYEAHHQTPSDLDWLDGPSDKSKSDTKSVRCVKD